MAVEIKPEEVDGQTLEEILEASDQLMEVIQVEEDQLMVEPT